MSAYVSGKGSILAVLAIVLAFGATANAQFTTTFTKDDCNTGNNQCGASNCDDVTPPQALPVRGSPADGTVQYVVQATNDGTAESGLTLEDLLPACAQIDCNNPCIDTNCDGTPDAVTQVTFSGGGSADAPTCDEANNSLTVSNITLEANETIEVRFCATFTAGGLCCNDATLNDGAGRTQSTVDALNGQDEMCVNVEGGGGGAFWKDDCGNRTGDAADCDDVGVNAQGDRSVDAPASGKAVQWVLHADNTLGTQDFNITDTVGADETVSCAPGDDPLGQGWGCFEILIDGVPIPPGPDDTCIPGPGGSIDVTENVPVGSSIEVRFCARINDNAGQTICNNDAFLTPTQPPNPIPATDNLDGDNQVCISSSGAVNVNVTATKTDTDVNGGLVEPGDQIDYHIELCEALGQGDATVDFNDPIPANITNAQITTNPGPCAINAGNIECPGLVLPAGGDPCPNPTVIEWSGEVTCDGLTDGQDICNQGQVTVTDPPTPQPIPTDDPDVGGDFDPTCFPIALDFLGDSTKDVAITDDVDGDTVPDCQEDTLTYTIEVISSGTNDATSVDLTDVLPSGLVYVPNSTFVDGVQQSPDPFTPPDTLQLNLGDMPTGTNHVVTFQATIDAVADGSDLCNQAEFESDTMRTCNFTEVTDDPNTGIEDDSTCITVSCNVTPEPAFDPTKAVQDQAGDPVEQATPGTEVEFVIDWCNTGTAPGTNVTFDDELDPCLEYLAGSTLLDGAPVDPDPFDPGPPATISFVADTSQNVGECHTVEFRATVVDDPNNCPANTLITNTASVSSDEGISAGSNETSFEIVPAEPAFDPTKTVLDRSDPADLTDVHDGSVSPDTPLVYQVDWCNTGFVEATDVDFSDQLPACLVYDPDPDCSTGVWLDTYGPATGTCDGAVTPDPFDGTDTVSFVADDTQETSECHTVWIDVTVSSDPSCSGTTVDNVATVSSADGTSADSVDPEDDPQTSFSITEPSITLRRNDELVTRSPTNPPKDPNQWGTIMDFVGGCDPAQARLGPEDDMATATFPPTECLATEGEPSFPDNPLVFYEVAGDCAASLTVTKTDCDDDGSMDLLVEYQ